MNDLKRKKSAISYKEIALWLAYSFNCFNLNTLYKIEQILALEEED